MPARFDTYYRYAELTALLHEYAAAFSGLCRLQTLGQSPEGRELWLLEVTNLATGPAAGKPGFYMDGNIHAGEVTSSAACLYTIHHLLNGYGADPEITQLVDTTAFYIRPRVSPDGAELYLTTPANLRSAPRPYPTAVRQPGLHPQDVDGDGWITQLRIADPDGDWLASPDDPRLMIARGEDETGGTYYRLYPEGLVHGPAGTGPLRVAPAYWGLDLNRNFPANWQPEHVQRGSGPYPLSEPETRASAEFILAHPNIGMAVCYHTAGHFVFRPPSSRPARDFPSFDIETIYGVLGRRYEQLVGGAVVQSYGEATGTARIGSLMDWAYQHLGIVGWVPEMWAWGRDYDGDGKIGDLDRLRWNDEELGGEGFVPWHPFEHPQLGPVEIGGWKTKFTSQNPPAKLLTAEIEPHYRWSLYLAHALPRLAVGPLAIEPLGERTYRVTATVANTGLLPTNVTDQALRVGRAGAVEAELTVQGLELLHGSAVQNLGHLAGRIARPSQASPARTATATWIVRGDRGRLLVKATADRAGTAQAMHRI